MLSYSAFDAQRRALYRFDATTCFQGEHQKATESLTTPCESYTPGKNYWFTTLLLEGGYLLVLG